MQRPQQESTRWQQQSRSLARQLACYGGRLAVLPLALLVTVAAVSPASAHGAGETEVGYVLVQQALGHLAHDSGHAGMETAMEKVNDALATKDQAGVDVAEVRQAKLALEAENVEPARRLLQHSILGATSRLMPAMGGETGTTVVLSPLRGRGGLSRQDLGIVGASVLLVLTGLALAVRFRPEHSLRQLRRTLAPIRSHKLPRKARP